MPRELAVPRNHPHSLAFHNAGIAASLLSPQTRNINEPQDDSVYMLYGMDGVQRCQNSVLNCILPVSRSASSGTVLAPQNTGQSSRYHNIGVNFAHPEHMWELPPHKIGDRFANHAVDENAAILSRQVSPSGEAMAVPRRGGIGCHAAVLRNPCCSIQMR